jgi:hypothetical protein
MKHRIDLGLTIANVENECRLERVERWKTCISNVAVLSDTRVANVLTHALGLEFHPSLGRFFLKIGKPLRGHRRCRTRSYNRFATGFWFER